MSDLSILVNIQPKSNLERNIKIFKEYKQSISAGDSSLRKISLKYGVSKQRIHQIIHQIELKILKGEIK